MPKCPKCETEMDDVDIGYAGREYDCPGCGHQADDLSLLATENACLREHIRRLEAQQRPMPTSELEKARKGFAQALQAAERNGWTKIVTVWLSDAQVLFAATEPVQPEELQAENTRLRMEQEIARRA